MYLWKPEIPTLTFCILYIVIILHCLNKHGMFILIKTFFGMFYVLAAGGNCFCSSINQLSKKKKIIKFSDFRRLVCILFWVHQSTSGVCKIRKMKGRCWTASASILPLPTSEIINFIIHTEKNKQGFYYCQGNSEHIIEFLLILVGNVFLVIRFVL